MRGFYVIYTNAVPQGEPRDAAINFDMYRILKWHRAVSRAQQGFVVCTSHRSFADVTYSTLNFTAMMHKKLGYRKETARQLPTWKGG